MYCQVRLKFLLFKDCIFETRITNIILTIFRGWCYLFAVYQVAIVVQHILPADLSLKHLLFHLAHLGGKVLLPATLYPVTSAKEFVVSVQAAFQRAVSVEKDYTVLLQKMQQLASRRKAGLDVGDTSSNNKSIVQTLPLSPLYSPFAFAGVDLQGPPALQEAIEGFVDRSRGTFCVNSITV